MGIKVGEIEIGSKINILKWTIKDGLDVVTGLMPPHMRHLSEVNIGTVGVDVGGTEIPGVSIYIHFLQIDNPDLGADLKEIRFFYDHVEGEHWQYAMEEDVDWAEDDEEDEEESLEVKK